MSDVNLQMAAQCGATELVAPFPGTELAPLIELRDRAAQAGLKLSTIERLVPHDKIVHNKEGRDEQIEVIKTLIRNMGEAGLTTMCYNWMPADDWSRTATDVAERGGALVTEFDVAAKDAELGASVLHLYPPP
eukprot:SAG11_NODE_19325_length_469_cov_0.835135_1_plen_133_part_01